MSFFGILILINTFLQIYDFINYIENFNIIPILFDSDFKYKIIENHY